MPPVGTILFGIALALDGHTLSIDGDRIRLRGIEAPDLRQNCERNGESYGCGIEAAAQLTDLLGRARVICTVAAHDEKVALASCEAGGRDLATAMLESGWAFAVPGSGRANAALEREAREARRGLWSGSAEPPWIWRMRNP